MSVSNVLSRVNPQTTDNAAIDRPVRIALVGSPNIGKTSLFNQLTGLRMRTANYPGTTIECRWTKLRLDKYIIELIDLPGMYSLDPTSPDENIAVDVLLGKRPGQDRPDALLVIADASKLERTLLIVRQLLRLDLPFILVVNMMDIAQRNGQKVDPKALSETLGVPVCPMVASKGEGLVELRQELLTLLHSNRVQRSLRGQSVPACTSCNTCSYKQEFTWTKAVASQCQKKAKQSLSRHGSERMDRLLTHPILGILIFFVVILMVFYGIFQLASVPMDFVDALFAHVGHWVGGLIPEGDLNSLVVDGIIAGVSGVLIFLPQICILFFFLCLLEDSGYLARAAFVMDRLMHHIGLPGSAFVPLLSAHACAIPAIMATRVIQNKRDRLLTILVAPLMTCSARLPVYAMVAALLFAHSPFKAAVLFVGAYCLGIIAALGMAALFRRTILPGERQPLVLELPSYTFPSLRNALLYTYDRSMVFVKQAGTIILLVSVGLWFLATYPKLDDVPDRVIAMQNQAEKFVKAGEKEKAAALISEAEWVHNQSALEYSFAGRMGQLIEPTIRPLGFDWRIGIGIISSFVAREVIVSTLAIVYGIGADQVDDEPETLYQTLREAKRKDGLPVFTLASSLSLLTFYILAMQCLPTQAVTRRETNSWKWPVFQFMYMSILAYISALFVYQVLHFLGYD